MLPLDFSAKNEHDNGVHQLPTVSRMMTLRTFFIGSLVLNAVLLAVMAMKPALAPEAWRERFTKTEAPSAPAATTLPVAAEREGLNASRRSSSWAPLESKDLPTLITRLRAAGFPPGLIRSIVNDRLEAEANTRLRELNAARQQQPYWKSEANNPFTNPAFLDSYNQVYRERAKRARELFKDEFFATDDTNLTQQRQFGGLSAAKIDQLKLINEDYGELQTQVSAATHGIFLPEDREKFALLEREKKADLAALLTPDELADYEMRSSNATARLRQPMTLMNATEDESRRIFQIEQAYEAQLNPPGGFAQVGPDQMQQRQTIQQQKADEIKGLLGDQRYADFARASSPEFASLVRITENQNIPLATATQAYDLRDNVAQESNRIFNEASLSVEQKRAALQLLAQNTKTQILSLLGPTAGEAYTKSAPWLSAVERGQSVTFRLNGASYRNLTPVPINRGTP